MVGQGHQTTEGGPEIIQYLAKIVLHLVPQADLTPEAIRHLSNPEMNQILKGLRLVPQPRNSTSFNIKPAYFLGDRIFL
jgi:hypothetical protein